MTDTIPTSEETEQYKKNLIADIKKQLRDQSFIDLTGWVETYATNLHFKHPGFVRDVAYRIKALGLVDVIPVEDWKRFYVRKLRPEEQKPFRYSLWAGTIASLISAIIGSGITLLVQHLDKKEQASQNSISHTTGCSSHASASSIPTDHQSHPDTVRK